MKKEFWRVKRRDKRGVLHEIGALHFTGPGGARINTKCAPNDVAGARRFKRDWLAKHHPEKASSTVVEGTADAPLSALDDGAEPAAAAASPPTTPPAAPLPPPAPEPPRALPPIAPDGYAPPPVGDWAADAARAAAGPTGGVEPPPGLPQFDPAFIDKIIEMAADRLIALQILGQALAIRYVGNLAPGETQIDDASRGIAREGWKTTIKTLLPDTIETWPPWAVALGVTALATLPTQLMTAKRIEKKGDAAGEQQQQPADETIVSDQGAQAAA